MTMTCKHVQWGVAAGTVRSSIFGRLGDRSLTVVSVFVRKNRSRASCFVLHSNVDSFWISFIRTARLPVLLQTPPQL